MMTSGPRLSTPSGVRRKSSKGNMLIKLKVSPARLRSFVSLTPNKVETPSKEFPSSAPPSPTSTPVPNSLNTEYPSESASNTPVAAGTPNASLMPPPSEVPKKKGVKRTAASALGPDGLPKPRGKPGPKKKARLEDGSIDHSQSAPRAPNGTAHKLGPKANQGAINAGLRALDRSGKPCRKWQRGGFKVKSFTGIIWELPRWKAPPKVKLDNAYEGSSTGDSGKENKDNSLRESEKSDKSGVDVDVSNGVQGSSPAPSSGLKQSFTSDATPESTSFTQAPAISQAEANGSDSSVKPITTESSAAPIAALA